MDEYMFKAISNWKSENWGGLVSALGSCVMLATGGTVDLIAAPIALVSSIVLNRKGETTLGYSLGCAGIGLSGFMLCYSKATAGNPPLQLTVGAVSFAWSLGVTRYPIERAGLVAMRYSERLGNGLRKTADIIQPAVGTVTLLFRLPILYAAVFSGEDIYKVMLISNMCWGLSSVLVGKVQDVAKGPLKTFALYADKMTGHRISKYVVRPVERFLQSICGPTKSSGPSG